MAGHANVSVTLNVYADEFDKATHRDHLIARIDKAGFGTVEGVLTWVLTHRCRDVFCS